MREFRIKVNNEKTYVVKAKDYNQAVKTLHSKLRDFDDTKKNINVVREFITNNGGKFSKSKDADAILDFIYKKTGVKNADYGDVLYIVKNYTNVKVEDNAVNDSISKYNGEDAIKTNGFVKIKEDGDWTSYKYNGSDFDDAVFKIHQYNPSLIAFISNGNRTITVRNKYLNDADDTVQGEIEVLKSFGFDYKDGRWVKESNNNDIIVQPDYHYVSVIGPDDTEKHCKKYQYQSAGMLKKIIVSNIKDSSIKDDLTQVETYKKSIIYIDDNGYYYHTPIGGRGAKAQKDNTKDINIVKKRIDNDYSFLYDSSIKDVSYVSGKNLKIGQKIVEDGEVLEVVDIKETQRGINNNYRDVTLKNVKTGATETVHFVNSALARLKDRLIESGSKEALSKNIATEIKAGKDPKQAAAIAYSVQRENDASTGYKYRITNNGSKWYYETTFPDGHTTLTGPYSSKQETEQYFHKHRPTEKLTDADPVKVEKIIRKEKSALGITYYLFQTKSNSGATIYFEVTDKSYHGEPTYSGGGIISFSLQSANDSLDSHLLYDKLVSKYGKDAGRKRFLLGKNDSAVKDSNNIKNRKSYTIKVGDKQYKVFAESESEAINKYIKSKRQ